MTDEVEDVKHKLASSVNTDAHANRAKQLRQDKENLGKVVGQIQGDVSTAKSKTLSLSEEEKRLADAEKNIDEQKLADLPHVT
jgi:hypothetical protein